MQFVSVLCQVEGYRTILKLSCRPLLLLHIKLFWKTKRGLKIFLLPHFLHDFRRKIFLLFYSANWSNFNVWVPLLYWAIVYCNCLLTRLWRIKFWDWSYFSNQAGFCAWPKSQDKNLNIMRTKRAFKIKKKHFLPFLKGFNWSK